MRSVCTIIRVILLMFKKQYKSHKNMYTIVYFYGPKPEDNFIFKTCESISDAILTIIKAAGYKVENNQLFYLGKISEKYTDVIQLFNDITRTMQLSINEEEKYVIKK